MRRLAILVSAAAVLVAVGAGLAGSSTRVERWVAFHAGTLAPGVHVVASARGSCVAGSLADPRPDAWRCLSGNQLQDPCFSGGGSSVICPEGTPDSRDALRLGLVKPLPRARANPPGGSTSGYPWVIETGGLYCYRAVGAVSVLAGRRVSYECAGASVLAGRPDRSRPVWTISLLPTSASKHYRAAPISSAWW